MKIEKLPSGNYRVQKQINGKRHSFTFDHKPKQRELLEKFADIEDKRNNKLTFKSAAESFIEARLNVLSPSTVKEYKGTVRRLSDEFLKIEIDKMTANDVQKEINHFASNRAPKTVRNYHAFIASVLQEFRPSLSLHTNLPSKHSKTPYIPSKEDIRMLLDHAKGTPYEVPILLACASLRRGEICALTLDDIEGNIVHVTKDMVLDEHKNWVIKSPKTPQSVRSVFVPDEVVEAIDRNGLYKGHPNSISDWMDKAEKDLGLEHFSLHKCRHYFASAAHAAGVPNADIMKAGGWKTDEVMKRVYIHSLTKDNSAATSAVFKNIL